MDAVIVCMAALTALLPDRPVFTVQDLADHTGHALTSKTRDRLLVACCEERRIERIRRGIYARLPIQSELLTACVAATHLAPDAVIAFGTALEVLGLGRDRDRTCTFLTTSASLQATRWRGISFRRASHPRALLDTAATCLETAIIPAAIGAGSSIRVTTAERTFVDLLARQRLMGEWPPLWATLSVLDQLDLRRVVAYVEQLDNATVAAKVGWFLERHEQAWHVDPRVLAQLELMAPRRPLYFERLIRTNGQHARRWNLMVPATLADLLPVRRLPATTRYSRAARNGARSPAARAVQVFAAGTGTDGVRRVRRPPHGPTPIHRSNSSA